MVWINKAKANRDAGIKGTGRFASIFDVYDYPYHIQELRKSFNEIYIYLLDDMKSDPICIMHEIYDFLGIKKIIPKDLGQVYNRAGSVKKSKRTWVVSAKSSILKMWLQKLSQRQSAGDGCKKLVKTNMKK